MLNLSSLSQMGKNLKNSPVGNMASDLGRSVTGNVETAVLKIYDKRNMGSDPAPKKNTGCSTCKKWNECKFCKKDPDQSSNLPKGPAMLTPQKLLGEITETAKPKEKTFRVQFNPSELTFFAQGTEHSASNIQPHAKGKQGVINAVEPVPVEMGLSLLFDHVNIYDAFMWDKATMGVSASGITNAASAVAGAMGRVWSVQPEVEGLLAALYNHETREVLFQWNDFHFRGLLTAVMATYTMFSVSGRPIRAKVDIRLRQVMTKEFNEDWMDDYKKVLGIGDASSLVRSQQKIGSLLNLNL